MGYLPAPIDVPPIQGILPDGSEAVRPSDDSAPFSALAFKVMADPYGKLTFVRMYSGILEKGSYVLNSTKDEKERISRLVVLKADDREEVDQLRAGDLGAVLGLKNTTTGDTLCSADDSIVLETLFIPEPVISVAVEPKTKGDMEKLSKALAALANFTWKSLWIACCGNSRWKPTSELRRSPTAKPSAAPPVVRANSHARPVVKASTAMW